MQAPNITIDLQHDLRVVDVIHFDQFNLRDFQAKYQKLYRVILPGNWRRILDSGDATILASQVEP